MNFSLTWIQIFSKRSSIISVKRYILTGILFWIILNFHYSNAKFQRDFNSEFKIGAVLKLSEIAPKGCRDLKSFIILMLKNINDNFCNIFVKILEEWIFEHRSYMSHIYDQPKIKNPGLRLKFEVRDILVIVGCKMYSKNYPN